jgi:hypothetical protein
VLFFFLSCFLSAIHQLAFLVFVVVVVVLVFQVAVRLVLELGAQVAELEEALNIGVRVQCALYSFIVSKATAGGEPHLAYLFSTRSILLSTTC